MPSNKNQMLFFLRRHLRQAETTLYAEEMARSGMSYTKRIEAEKEKEECRQESEALRDAILFIELNHKE